MDIRLVEWTSYDRDGLRVLFASRRNDLTAPQGVTYIDLAAGEAIKTDVVEASEAFRFRNQLLAQGYARGEWRP